MSEEIQLKERARLNLQVPYAISIRARLHFHVALSTHPFVLFH